MINVKLQTSKGNITLELNDEKAPKSVQNFLEYVDAGHYNGTIFHRVIEGFMIQGGGMDKDLKPKSTNNPIENEASNGLKNDRGSIAMARTNDPDSATSQFFINHKNNSFLNYSGPANPGYAVFGKVIDGMDVVDAIAQEPTTSKGYYDDVPEQTIEIISAEKIE